MAKTDLVDYIGFTYIFVSRAVMVNEKRETVVDNTPSYAVLHHRVRLRLT